MELKMPALSPTMETGSLARWLVGTGDLVRAGDPVAEVETDKATMEVEAPGDGRFVRFIVAEGTDNVAVGTVLALLEDAESSGTFPSPDSSPTDERSAPSAEVPDGGPSSGGGCPPLAPGQEPVVATAAGGGDEQSLGAIATDPAGVLAGASPEGASPLASRLALRTGMDLTGVVGTGPGGRVIKADVIGARRPAPPARTASPIGRHPVAEPAMIQTQIPAATFPTVPDVPHGTARLSGMRRTIARRLTESKQQVPHIYLTVDVRLDALLSLRTGLNAEAGARGVRLSVNDMLVKALAAALVEVPSCNVMFTPDQLVTFDRADISVAVSTPTGLITPVVVGAEAKSLSAISAEVRELAGLAREGRLAPEQYQGGTASISNMGMYGIKQFDAVINPPQGMILAVGTGERRSCVSSEDRPDVATIMSATGSFDHRAIDGADGAALMRAFKALVETPMMLLV